MPICKHCGEPIYQTRGGSWVHADGRGICSWAEPADSGRRVRVHAHPLGEPCPPSCAHSSGDPS